MAYTELEARELVAEAGRKLLEKGLVARTWGNISARVSDTHFIITPSGMAYDTMKPQQLVLVDGRDGSWEGDRKPSSEKGIHADAYRLRPEVSFVIHTHQDMASVLGVAGMDLVTGHPLLGGRVPCAAYGLPSTDQLRQAVAREMEDWPRSPAILLRHHGAVCLGQSMDHAFAVAEALEEVCGKKVQKTLPIPDLPLYVPDFGESVRQGVLFYLTISGKTQVFPVAEPSSLPPAAALHAAIYWGTSAQAVVHQRGRDTVAMSASGKPLRPMLDDQAQIAGANLLCVSPSPQQVLRGLRGRNAVLLREAGALCTGSCLEDAQAAAHLLEKGCTASRFSAAISRSRPLGRGDALLQRTLYVTQYAKRKG